MMEKTWARALSAFVLTLACAASAWPRPGVPRAVRRAAASVFSLSAGGHTICTAFAVGTHEGPRLMSAGHCAEGMVQGEVVTAFNAESDARYEAALESAVYEWPRADYSVFRFVGALPPAALRESGRMPAPGDPVYTVAGPLGFSPVIADGLFQGRVICTDDPRCQEEIGGLYFATVTGDHGASGAPVLDSKGRVFGIFVGGFDGVKLPWALIAEAPKVSDY
jgi:S1-C subfamily serine protease